MSRFGKQQHWLFPAVGRLWVPKPSYSSDLRILDGFSLPFLFFPLPFSSHWIFFFLPLSQALLDSTEVIWENPWKVLPEFVEETHLSESQFKIFFNLRDRNNLLNQQKWPCREKVALFLWYVHAKLFQSCLTLCDPVDDSLPGSSVRDILQARVLEWVTVPFSRGSSWPRDRTCVSYVFCISRWILYH